jgi:predicted TIM-barrel fold metal-dependent hydrolase
VTSEQRRPIGDDPGHIDVHHHVVPEFFRKAANAAGVLSGGAPWPEWQPADTLRMLDEQRIDSALVSIAPPGAHFGVKADTIALTRRCNDYMADLVRTYPDRLGAFGVLPLPYVDEAVREIEYILDVLGLDGVGLYTNAAGLYLGDDRLEPAFAELHRRRAVAYLHPAEPPVDPAPGLSLPPWYGEFVFDTTRALTNMLVHGTLERNSGMSLIVAHAGGTAPYIVNRITNVWREMPEARLLAPEGPLAYLRKLYYDTASCGPGFGLRLVRDMMGTSQIVLGSDYPFVPAHSVSRFADNLRDPRFLGVDERVLRSNALRLFPRFATARDIVRQNVVGIHGAPKQT